MWQSFFHIIGILLCIIINYICKLLLKNSEIDLFKRPVPYNNLIGMPSGHSHILTYILLTFKLPICVQLYLCFQIIKRYIFQYHTMFQIIVGIIFGYFTYILI